jgi:hypothetical protein
MAARSIAAGLLSSTRLGAICRDTFTAASTAAATPPAAASRAPFTFRAQCTFRRARGRRTRRCRNLLGWLRRLVAPLLRLNARGLTFRPRWAALTVASLGAIPITMPVAATRCVAITITATAATIFATLALVAGPRFFCFLVVLRGGLLVTKEQAL